MAPRKKRTTENREAPTSTPPRVTRSADRLNNRATRSATARGDAALVLSVSDPEPRKGKKAKITKTVIIEHCTESKSIGIKASQVKKGLEEGISGVNVVINPEAPRENHFEIRDEKGTIFMSLNDPVESLVQQLEALDIKKVVSNVAGKMR